MRFSRAVRGAALIAGVAFASFGLQSDAAAEFPSRPIEVVVPMTAGGPSDSVVRLLQRAIEADLPQPMVVINMPGAGTALGSRQVATAEADGHTVLMNHEALFSSSAQGIFELGRSTLKPVAMTGLDAYVITVRADSPYETLDQLYEAARDGRVVTGVNIGGLNHLTSLIAARAAGVEFQPVQYGGNADALAALLGGHIDVMFSPPADIVGYIEAEELRGLAIMTTERLQSLPQVPTTLELGYDAISELSHMWWVPAGTSDETVAELAALLEKGFQDETVREQFERRHIARVFLSGEEIEARVEHGAAVIEGLIEEFDLKAN